LNTHAGSQTDGALQIISSNHNYGSLVRNRTGYEDGDPASLSYIIGHIGDGIIDYTTPTVTWLRNGIPARATPTNSALGTNGRLSTTLSFTFAESDAGVYQCVFTDPARSEVFVTIPIRLDTGKCNQNRITMIVSSSH